MSELHRETKELIVPKDEAEFKEFMKHQVELAKELSRKYHELAPQLMMSSMIIVKLPGEPLSEGVTRGFCLPRGLGNSKELAIELLNELKAVLELHGFDFDYYIREIKDGKKDKK